MNAVDFRKSVGRYTGAPEAKTEKNDTRRSRKNKKLQEDGLCAGGSRGRKSAVLSSAGACGVRSRNGVYQSVFTTEGGP
jgi:hypothetical protein